MNLKDYFLKGLSYQDYWELIENQAKQGKTSGPTQSPSLVGYTKLNFQRMKRLNKSHGSVSRESTLQRGNLSYLKWLVITETWCGDAAQLIPAMRVFAEENGIELRMVLRDENPELMEAFLTNGTKSIPKLIMCDDNYDALTSWGPRPRHPQKQIEAFKAGTLALTMDELKSEMQVWYNKDAGKTTIEELTELIAGFHKSD